MGNLIWGKAIENLGKSNGKFGKKQWEIQAKAIIFARNICRRFPSFLIAFARIFPLLLPEKIWAKAMRKLGKRWDIYFGQILWKFLAISRIDILFSKFTS